MKKFHSDNYTDEKIKKDHEEISKCIISAYNHLCKPTQSNKESPENAEDTVFSV
jgi:hypothetical protein